jgi:hypothetical protein
MTLVLASAADARYGNWLINLVGSVQRRSNIFGRIAVYDLGLTAFQRRLLEGARGVDVHDVPPFVPHWREAFTWKPWIWTHVEADEVVWLDAGLSVLRPLTAFVDGIEQRGYFVVSQGVKNRECIPSEYYELYDLPPEIGARDVVAGGILGFHKQSDFYSRVVVPTFDDAVLGRNLGYSPGDAERFGLPGDVGRDIVRDCPLFRWDQPLVNIHFYRSFRDPVVGELDRFAGFRSPKDHPEQVIWGHRRRGDYRFLPRVAYRPATAVIGRPWGTYLYLRGRLQHYRWLMRPALYFRLALSAGSRARARARMLSRRRA